MGGRDKAAVVTKMKFIADLSSYPVCTCRQFSEHLSHWSLPCRAPTGMEGGLWGCARCSTQSQLSVHTGHCVHYDGNDVMRGERG